MSKIALKPNASGTGVFSLEAPDSNTDRTLNLPDESGTIFSDGTGVPGSALSGDIDVNKISLQNQQVYGVVDIQRYHITNASTNVNVDTFTDVGPSISFTPKKSGNIIMVQHSVQIWNASTSDGSGDAHIRFLVDGSEVWDNDRARGNFDADERRTHVTVNSHFLFNASSSSSHTIQFQALSTDAPLLVALNFYHSGANPSVNQYILVEYQT